jgi:FdhD protein
MKRAEPDSVPATADLEESVREVAIDRYGGGAASAEQDGVAREEPLEIQVGGVSIAVVMRTPGNDEELALGFLLTERIVPAPGAVASIRHCTTAEDPDAAGNVIRVTLAPGVTVDVAELRRNLYASSSCGLCGKATIAQAIATAPPLDDGSRFPAAFFHDVPTRLGVAQAVFRATGGLHAAGLFAPDGTLGAVREDVGRHNAVDKVVGHAARAGSLPLAGHVLAVSGRISFEIVQKALAARIPVVAAVSAPTSLAVELAIEAGITLVGFLRGRSMNVYGARDRVVPS